MTVEGWKHLISLGLRSLVVIWGLGGLTAILWVLLPPRRSR